MVLRKLSLDSLVKAKPEIFMSLKLYSPAPKIFTADSSTLSGEKPIGKGNNLNLILKCNFRLLGLVNAYDLDKRYKKTKKSCVRALYKLIKEKTKRKKTQERLEKDYYSFMKCQPS